MQELMYAYFCIQIGLFQLISLLQQFQYILQLFFLHLQFSQSKYSPTSHDLSHLHLQLPGFQINPLSHSHLSINYLHSHLHLSSIQRCLLLQTLPSNLHLHLQVSCHSMCLVSLVLGFLTNSDILLHYVISSLNICECLLCHQHQQGHNQR